MDLVEISPFLLILSEKDYKGEYTEITLENYEDKLSINNEYTSIKPILTSLLNEFPHKNYIPANYILKHPLLRAENPCELLSCLLEFSNLNPSYNNGRLCFSFQNKQKIAKIAGIIDENPNNMFAEVIKLAMDTKKINIGEDLVVILTDGLEAIFKNTSEGYLKCICDNSKENIKGKRKLQAPYNPQILKPRALRDISNSGN